MREQRGCSQCWSNLRPPSSPILSHPTCLTPPVSPLLSHPGPRAGGEGRRRFVVTPATADDGGCPPTPHPRKKKKSFKSIDCKSFCQRLSHGEPDQRKQTVSSASEHVLVCLPVRPSVRQHARIPAMPATTRQRLGAATAAQLPGPLNIHLKYQLLETKQ